jgi:hypothetical protein
MTETIAMKRVTMPVAEHLYDAKLRLTGVIEYGVNMQALLSGRISPPPQGARFDLPFEGFIEGPKLKGTVEGIDYLEIRADGRNDLNLHAEITTDDGDKIALSADGIFVPDPETGIGQVRENARLTTASQKYAWVNQLQVWVTGTSNLNTFELSLKGYAA